MKVGTKVYGTLIADCRSLGNAANVETKIAILRDSLKTSINGEGMEVYSLGSERLLEHWGKEKKYEPQIRQNFELILTEKKTKNQIYEIINLVQSQPLKIKSY